MAENNVKMPGLVVDIEARIDKLEKGIAKANATHKRGSTEMENRARQSSRKLEDTYSKSAGKINKSFEEMLAPLMKGIGSVGAVGAVALALKDIASSVAEVDREARKVGLSAKAWQQWNYVATATGATIDGIGDGLKELQLRGAEFFSTGSGSAADAFKRLGYSAADVGEQLRDPSRFLDDIISKLQKLSSADQIFNADALFGGQGQEQIGKLLGLSVEQIKTLRSEAATFSAEQIEAAKKVDAQWSTMWMNFSVHAKAAAIDGVNVAASIAKAIREAGESVGAENWLSDTKLAPGALDAGKQAYQQRQQLAELSDLVKRRAELMAELANMTPTAKALGFGDSASAELKAVDDKIREVQQALQDTRPAVDSLKTSVDSLAPAMKSNATAAADFKKALLELKNLVPELKAELDTLAQSGAMNTAYQNAARNARSWGKLMQATDIAGRARSVSTFGNQTNMLDLIGAAEGTDKGRGYNETLDYGRWTGGAQELTTKTLDEILALQRTMLADPANRAMYQDKAGNNVGSSALGRYQITSTTLKDMMRELGLAGDRKFDASTQDEIARALMRRRGDDPAGLRNEWEGLRRVDDGTIRSAWNGTATGKTTLDPSNSQKAATDLLKQQDETRKSLNRTVQEGLDLARFEQSISSMSASQQKIELQLYQAQAEAKRAGITLTDAEINVMRQKITMTQQLDEKNKQVSTSTEGLQNAQRYFAEGFTSSLSGLLQGTQTLQGALSGLVNSLIDATLQAALLGKGPLAGLFGSAGSGILGSIFGFASGGYTGNGAVTKPAGVVHKGEYVMSAAATRRLGAANLETLHRGALKGFSSGGYVGSSAPVDRSAARSSGNNQTITINAPVTVNASGGTEAQNSDLSRKVAKQIEATMRTVVVSEIQKQMKPGNTLGGKRR
jgi:muramidase (phage lysozyme)